tara:strand:- start:303 stop:425 length:123 start_codon:yes stop_codon:yes gene_type:complete
LIVSGVAISTSFEVVGLSEQDHGDISDVVHRELQDLFRDA